MALTAASLNVKLTADTSGFSKGLKRGQREIQSFASSVTGSIGSLKTAFAGLAAAVGVGLSANAFKNFVQGSLDAIDANAKMADRLGTSTENLVGLQHAAGLAGADVETLGKSLDLLNRTLGDANSGSKSAADAFKNIGLDPAKLKGQDLVTTFGQIADQINQYPDQARKAAAAQNLFGRSSADLLATLALGSKGLAENKAEAENLGLAYSRIDASKVEEANDAVTKMEAAFRGLGNAIAIAVSPFLTMASNAITDFVKGGLGINTVTESILSLAKAMGPLLDSLHQLRVFHSVFRDAENPEALRKILDQMPSLLIDKAIENIRKQMRTASADVPVGAPPDQWWSKNNGSRTGSDGPVPIARAPMPSDFGPLAKERLSDFFERAVADLAKDLETPREAFAKTFQHLQGLAVTGDLSPEMLQRGMANARREFLSSSGLDNVPQNAAIEAGTIEAFRAAREQDNPIRKALEKELRELEEQTEVQQNILRAIENNVIPVAEIIA